MTGTPPMRTVMRLTTGFCHGLGKGTRAHGHETFPQPWRSAGVERQPTHG